MDRTAYDVAADYMRLGIRERAGLENHPAIMHMLTLDHSWPQNDETPWCGGFANTVCFNAGRERTKSLLARSFLGIGLPIELDHARVGNDVVVLKRGSGVQPGPEDVNAPGHVGFFAGATPDTVFLLGGNQSDAVNIREYPISRLLGVRRLRSLYSLGDSHARQDR